METFVEIEFPQIIFFIMETINFLKVYNNLLNLAKRWQTLISVNQENRPFRCTK
jgi:hypothetical protein